MQRLTLPAEADYQEPQSDDEPENEDVPDLREDDNFWADWMREAGRRPNQEVESMVDNLGLRDMDVNITGMKIHLIPRC